MSKTYEIFQNQLDYSQYIILSIHTLDTGDAIFGMTTHYSQTFCIRRTKLKKNLNISRLVLQLHLHNPLEPGVQSRMKM